MQNTLQHNLNQAVGLETFDGASLDGPPGTSQSRDWLSTLRLVLPLWRFVVVIAMMVAVVGMHTTFSNDCAQVRKDLGQVRARHDQALIEQSRLQLEYDMRIAMSKLERAGLQRALVPVEEVWVGP